MKNLKSNYDFGIYLNSLNISDKDYRIIRDKYDVLLNTNIQKCHFVVCNDDGVFLEKPKEHLYNHLSYLNELAEYEKHQKKVLFDGFKYQQADKNNPMEYVYYKDDVTLFPEVFDDDKIEQLLYYKEFMFISENFKNILFNK